ncbi:MAG: hypothetical protein K6U03_12515, partial [Firmicutes bacterium]|nr:hypothetical protein [Bacillota bacterium]
GMILLCGIDLPRKQEIVPAAKVLYRNLLEYALDSEPFPKVRAGLLAEKDSELYRLLRILGAEVTFVDRDTDLEGLEVLVADGAKTPGFLPDPRTLRARIAEGMQLMIHNLTPETLPYYQELLPEEIGLRSSTREEQIKTAPEDPLLAGLNNADMYWLAQGLVNPIVDYGVDVSRAGSAKVLTQTPKTNWRSWAWQPEHVKTVAVLRSERDNPETVNGLVTIPLGKGRTVIDQIRASVQNEKSRRILSLLLTNLGVPLADHPADIETLIGADGYILQWLVLGSFPADNIESPLEHDFLGGEAAAFPAAGTETAGQKWVEVSTEPHAPTLALQDLFEPPGDAVAYAAVYIYSPRDATALLESPRPFRADLHLDTFN